MISAGSMPCRYTDAMPRSCVAELALDVPRYALACHFDRQVKGIIISSDVTVTADGHPTERGTHAR